MTRHEHLARAWANYNNKSGTPKQLARITKQLTEADLTRMLAERGQSLRFDPDGAVVLVVTNKRFQ